jgi:hypothetical protein
MFHMLLERSPLLPPRLRARTILLVSEPAT